MRKLKTVANLLLIFALIFGLAACGGGKEESTPEPEQQAPSESEAVEDVEEAVAEEEKIDLGGYTMRIAMWWDGEPKPDSEWGELAVQKKAELEQKYNVKIEYINLPWDQYLEKTITSIAAGQPFADVIKVDAGWFPGLAKQGLLLPVSDAFDYDKVMAEDKWPNLSPIFKSVGVWDGVQYGFDGSKAEAGTGMFYNRTLLEKLGMKDLNEYVKEGTWTWDTFAQVAKDATRDSDGDGKMDSWGLTAFHADFYFSLVASQSGKLFDEVGKKEGISSSESVRALELMQKLYHVDKSVRFENPGDWGEQRRMFPEGNVLMMHGYIWEINERAKDMGQNVWSFVPFPIAPGASDYVSGYPGLNFNVIPKGAKYPKETAKILFELNNFDTSTGPEEYPGQGWYEGVVTDEIAIENLKLAATKTFLGWQNAIKDFPTWIVADEVTKGQPISTTVEKYKTEAQAKIDEFFAN